MTEDGENLSSRRLKRLAKETRILQAALSEFAAQGYTGASMDAIAARATVSKPTLYQYFGTKDQLFAAIMREGHVHMLEPFHHPSGKGMVQDLHDFATAYAEIVLNPDFLSLARLIIGEAARFPEIGRAYQASGPERALQGIMDYLTAQRDAGRLSFQDAELAAEDLWSLILSALRNRALHHPDLVLPPALIARHIHNGLRVFLLAYSTNRDEDQRALARLIALKEP